MISIECPNCGRRGTIPPDRLSSRLHCKSCNAVIHLNRTGQLAVDESARETAEEGPEGLASAGEFHYRDVWQSIPPNLKLAVPVVIVLALLVSWIVTRSLPEPVPVDHAKVGETVLRAVVANDRERVMALADPPTADDAGHWFDLVRQRFEANEIGQDIYVRTTPISGNVEKDARVVLMGTLASKISDNQPPMGATIHIHRMKKGWIFDGTESLKGEEAGEAIGSQPAAETEPASPPPTAGKAP